MKNTTKNKKHYLKVFILLSITTIILSCPFFLYGAENPAIALASKGKEQLPTWISLVQLLVIAVLVWDFFKGVMEGNLPKQVIIQKLVLIALIGFAQPIVEFLMSWGSTGQ